MSDYTKSYNGAAHDAAEDIIQGSDFDTEFQAIETAIATKANKKIPAAVGNVATLSSSGDLQDGAVTATELAILDGATVTTAELNILDGVTATTAELNILDGVTSTAAELNILDGVTATTTELNYVSGVTSAIQTQLNTLSSSIYVDLITSWSATAVASKDFTWDEAVYSDVIFVIEDIIPATDGANLQFRAGHTNGGTIVTSASYNYSTFNSGDSAIVGVSAGTSFDLSGNVGTAAGEGCSGTVRTVGYGGSKNAPQIVSNVTYISPAGTVFSENIWGHVSAALTTPYDTARFYWDTGNFEANGTIYVYGIKR